MTDRGIGERLLEDGEDFVLTELSARSLGDVPEWMPAATQGLGTALAKVAARYFEVLGRRFDRAVELRDLAFLGLIGLRLVPPRPAAAPVAFQLADNAPDGRVPK